MSSELEVFSAHAAATDPGAGPHAAGIDITAAHLVDLRGEPAQWTLECFWLDAADPEGVLAAATAGRPCAVVSLCQQCVDSDQELPAAGAEYMAHGARHAMAGDPALPYELLPDVCGLALAFAEGEGGWMSRLHAEHGEGLYLVRPGVDADGRMIGVDPVRVVE